MKKLINPPKRSVIEPKEKGGDSKTLPSEVMYAMLATSGAFLKHQSKPTKYRNEIASKGKVTRRTSLGFREQV